MITLRNGSDYATIFPWKGASVRDWVVGGESILYHNPESFAQPQVKYQGGIPIMFPIFSTTKLDGASSTFYDSKKINLEQHGLARLSKAWRANHIEENQVICFLQANEESLKLFPYKFEFKYTVTLEDRALRIEQEVINQGKDDMPFVAGIHPFFSVSDIKNMEVAGIPYGTPYYLQLNSGERDFNAKFKEKFPFGEREINHHFKFSGQKVRLYDRGNGRCLEIEKSKEYPCITVWSEPEHPFVCIEPVSGRRGALETREDLIRLKRGESWSGEILFKLL